MGQDVMIDHVIAEKIVVKSLFCFFWVQEFLKNPDFFKKNFITLPKLVLKLCSTNRTNKSLVVVV